MVIKIANVARLELRVRGTCYLCKGILRTNSNRWSCVTIATAFEWDNNEMVWSVSIKRKFVLFVQIWHPSHVVFFPMMLQYRGMGGWTGGGGEIGVHYKEYVSYSDRYYDDYYYFNLLNELYVTETCWNIVIINQPCSVSLCFNTLWKMVPWGRHL